MGFYDNFSLPERSSITWIGQKIVNSQNNFFLNKIFNYRKENPINLLEIGPGRGEFAKICSNRGIKYTGLEANDLFFKDLTSKNFRVFKGIAPPIKIKEKFDIIFMNQVFEHMDDIKQAKLMIEECKNHLNKKGLLIICSPNYERWKEDFFISDYTHNFPTSIRRVKQMYFDYGFKIIYANKYCFFVRGNLQSYIVSKLARLCYNLGILHILFGKRAYKVKTSLLSSFILIGQNE